MYSRCILCSAALGANDLLERFPVGRKLAFDPERGRLWAICAKCGGWNLAPIEERWEPIEVCERTFRGTRIRTSTPNIGLATRRDGLELVRIGRPLRPELAAWRYAPRFTSRRRRAMGATLLGAGVFFGITVGIPIALGLSAGGFMYVFGAMQAFDEHKVVHRLPAEGLIIRREHIADLMWHPAHGSNPWYFEVPSLARKVSGDDRQSVYRPLALAGEKGMRLASLALNVMNRRDGTAAELEDAVDWLEVFGSPFTEEEDPSSSADAPKPDRAERRTALSARRSMEFRNPIRTALRVSGMRPYERLAFELAANESQERLFLTSHLWLLERHWREAEEIASIADNLLVPEAVSEGLQRLRTMVTTHS